MPAAINVSCLHPT